MNDVTQILRAAMRGENQASEELLPLVYDELRHLAAAQIARESGGQTLQATALVHEAWLRLVDEPNRVWHNRAHFFRAAALAMRRILVDRARQKSSLKRGGGRERVNLEDIDFADTSADERVLLIDEALGKLEGELPELARVVTLKFFGGLTNREVAESLGVTERTVERQWAYAKVSLFRIIREAL